MAISNEYLVDADVSQTNWSRIPNSAGFYDKLDEYQCSEDTADYVYTNINNAFLRMGIETPSESVSAVTNIKLMFYFSGSLLGSSAMGLIIYIYGDGVLKGNITVDANTGGLGNLMRAYVNIDVTGWTQTEYDNMQVGFRFLVGGGPYDPPEIET